jgi:hypothetical protein
VQQNISLPEETFRLLPVLVITTILQTHDKRCFVCTSVYQEIKPVEFFIVHHMLINSTGLYLLQFYISI